MLHLKQIQHKLLEMISESGSTTKDHFISLGHAVRNFPLAESLGILLSSLILLGSTSMYLIVVCISSLLWLPKKMWTKLQKQLNNTEQKESMFRSMLCRLGVGQKNTNSIPEESQHWQWSEVGAIHQDYTSISSEMHGELDKETLDEKARKAGL